MKQVSFFPRAIPLARFNGFVMLMARSLITIAGASFLGFTPATANTSDADGVFSGSFEATPNIPMTATAPCEATGLGTDYQVGPNGGQLASLDQVPWENLHAGDTVRIFYRADAYKGKFAINAHGTFQAPVRVCGVKGPNGERPIIDGNGANTRPTMSYGRNSASDTNQTRGIVMIVSRAEEEGVTQPEYIQIDGLKFRGAQPAYDYTDMSGNAQT